MSPTPALGHDTAGAPQPGPEVSRPAEPPWSAWREARRDWAAGLLLVVALAVLGVLVGLLWLWLAPRADFRITSDGPQVIGNPSEELLMADDGILVLLLAGLGLLAGVGTWLLRRRRGVTALVALAVGMVAAGVVAWRTGRLLAPPPSHAALTHVGGRVTTSLNVGSVVELAAGPFVAVLVYVVAALYARSDGLGREAPPAAPEPASR